MAWFDNAIMWWYDGATWQKITDHNRAPLQVDVERIENSQRMVDGTMRRYVVAKKHEFQVSWEMLPSRRNATYAGRTGLNTVDGGWAGEDIETFHNNTDTAFKMRLRGGDDESKAITDATIEEYTVMITDFNKEVTKRGTVDFWSLSVTLTEV